jgi:hypothetical protein
MQPMEVAGGRYDNDNRSNCFRTLKLLNGKLGFRNVANTFTSFYEFQERTRFKTNNGTIADTNRLAGKWQTKWKIFYLNFLTATILEFHIKIDTGTYLESER